MRMFVVKRKRRYDVLCPMLNVPIQVDVDEAPDPRSLDPPGDDCDVGGVRGPGYSSSVSSSEEVVSVSASPSAGGATLVLLLGGAVILTLC